jgi:hypothetical protein
MVSKGIAKGGTFNNKLPGGGRDRPFNFGGRKTLPEDTTDLAGCQKD